MRSLPAALLLVAVLPLAPSCGSGPTGEEVHVAVAANFAIPFQAIVQGFETATGHRVVVTTGSTGALYAQVVAGAPFEVFLAADDERPRRLVETGRAVAESRFTYARGRLALWWPGREIADGPALLGRGDFARLAMANPATAPYGRAARQALETLGVWPAVEPKVVLGNDVGQAYQFVATRNADVGFVARSQLDGESEGAAWLVPEQLHAPIEQQAVLLTAGAGDAAARDLLDWLRGDEAREVIERFGFGPGDAATPPPAAAPSPPPPPP
jgi:molybdate transport system substrate-binding protein